MHNGGGVIEARDKSMVTSSSNSLSPPPGPSVRLESQSRLRCVGSIKDPPDAHMENIDWPGVRDQPLKPGLLMRTQEQRKAVR